MESLQFKIDHNSNLYINNFWISINKNNDLEGVYIEQNDDNDNDKNDNNNKKVKIVEEIDKKINRKLQAKLIDDEIFKYKENDDEDDIQMISNYIYNPETKYINYHQDYDQDDDDTDDEEPYYDITGIADFTDNLLDLSIYEFYYFGLESIKFYTSIINDNPIYRISYFEYSNEIKLNIIGDVIKTYKITFDKENNKLIFVNTKVELTNDI
jgi:hypothetical protein